MRRYAVRLAVATLLVAAVGLGVPSPAQAAACSSARGVSVVVDFHQLGGGVETFCDSSGAGKTADAQLRDAGHSLTYVQRQPGFICRIDGEPVDDPCVNTPPGNAYWSLWWSDGTSGRWTYSSRGSASLKVPEGGYVAMSWQGQDAQAPPGIAPRPHPAAPSPTPSSRPSASPHPSPGTGQAPPASTGPADPRSTAAAVGTSGPRGSAGPRKQRVGHASKAARSGSSRAETRRGGQAAGPVGQVARPSDAVHDASGSGGLPGWVPPAAIALLFAGAGTVLLARRRSSGGG